MKTVQYRGQIIKMYTGPKEDIVSSHGNGFRIAPSYTGRESYILDVVCDDARNKTLTHIPDNSIEYIAVR